MERLLRELTTQRIRRGAFRSVPELETAIQGWLEERNADPKPFKWTATVDVILRKVEKYRRTYDTPHKDVWLGAIAHFSGLIILFRMSYRNSFIRLTTKEVIAVITAGGQNNA